MSDERLAQIRDRYKYRNKEIHEVSFSPRDVVLDLNYLIDEVDKLRTENAELQAKVTISEVTRQPAREAYEKQMAEHALHVSQLQKNCLQFSEVIESKNKKMDKLRAENERMRQLIEMPSLGLPKEMFSQGPEADQSELKACGRCGGQGWLEGWDDERRACPTCKGQGWSRDWEADQP